MLKILVADDEKDARDKMIKSINHPEKGITVIGKASDGLETIALIRELLPDIVLMDIQMPGMSGLEVIRIAKEENLSTVFVVISAYDEFSYARDCIRLDVKDYLLKPFLPMHICSAVFNASKSILAVKIIPFLHSESTTSNADSSLKESLFESGSISLIYPHETESIIIDNLLSNLKRETYSNLEDFFDVAKSINPSSFDIIYCYIILFVEIHRIIINLGLDLSSLNAYVSEIAEGSVEAFERMLIKLCDIIFTHFNNSGVLIDASNIITENAIDYINKHSTDELTLEQVAKVIYVSPCYLSRSFTNSLSISFTNYINTIRINNAAQIITDQPYLKNYEIAEMVGYKSTKYFGQQFKSIKGVTVSQFKRSKVSSNIRRK